jgi:hypothetical protein
MTPTVSAWMLARGITQVIVVSPHLDDAVFSLAGWLDPSTPGACTVAREVWTVFTSTRADADARHAHAMGFADPLQEFAARREEDIAALHALNLPWHHAQAQADRFTANEAQRVMNTLLQHVQQQGHAHAQTLLLLPAGAGGRLSTGRHLWRRLTRRPSGCGVHDEHVWVRDGLWPLATQAGLVVGAYGEVPYLWADDVAQLTQRVSQRHGEPLQAFRLRVDGARKMGYIRHYRSQFESEFGTKPGFQQRTAAVAELLLLPKA